MHCTIAVYSLNSINKTLLQPHKNSEYRYRIDLTGVSQGTKMEDGEDRVDTG